MKWQNFKKWRDTDRIQKKWDAIQEIAITLALITLAVEAWLDPSPFRGSVEGVMVIIIVLTMVLTALLDRPSEAVWEILILAVTGYVSLFFVYDTYFILPIAAGLLVLWLYNGWQLKSAGAFDGIVSRAQELRKSSKPGRKDPIDASS